MSYVRSFVTLAFIFGLMGCSQPDTNRERDRETATRPDAAYLLTDSTAGPFALGSALTDTSGGFSLRREKRPGPEGPPPQTVYHISQSGATVMTIIPRYSNRTRSYTDSIAEIIVFSDRFQTEERIGPGSTIEEFTKAYPEHEVWYTYVSDRFVLETPQHNMQFLLYAEDFTGDPDPKSEITPLSLDNFRNGALIRAVRLY